MVVSLTGSGQRRRMARSACTPEKARRSALSPPIEIRVVAGDFGTFERLSGLGHLLETQ